MQFSISLGYEEKPYRYSLQEKLQVLPKILPFLLIIFFLLYVLYGGVATPSEAAGVGSLCFLLAAVLIYRIHDIKKIQEIFRHATKESVMILMIVASAGLFSFTLSSLSVTQSIAQSIVELAPNKWLLLLYVNVFLLIAGLFLPPVAVIIMTAPILLPVITDAGFDPYWFGVILTINMEIGLITPPVGLNLYVINGIAPDIGLATILKGALPFVFCMLVGIIILCLWPEIALWLPDYLMG